MKKIPSSGALLLLPRLRIQNANAIGSPLTHGFPSITAFMGLMWALERRLGNEFQVEFDSVGVICHDHSEQVKHSGFVRSFCLTRNPLDRDGSTAAIVEEGRVHLELSLVFGIGGDILFADEEGLDRFARAALEALATMRVAGGSVLPPRFAAAPRALRIPEAVEKLGTWFRSIRRRLLPGFALVARDDLLPARLQRLREVNADATALDAWLDLSRFNWSPQVPDEKTGKVRWQHDRTEGWLVPIPVGYGSLAEYPAGAVGNARDPSLSFHFAESLYSIGQWIGPHRLSRWQDLVWFADATYDDGVFRACNAFAPDTTTPIN